MIRYDPDAPVLDRRPDLADMSLSARVAEGFRWSA